MRVEIATPSTTDPISLQVSPDGRQVVFVATFEGRPRLWLRRLDDLAAWALTGTDFAAHPFWSPDGRSLAFFADQRLKRLDLDGGAVQPLARVGVGLGGTWTRGRPDPLQREAGQSHPSGERRRWRGGSGDARATRPGGPPLPAGAPGRQSLHLLLSRHAGDGRASTSRRMDGSDARRLVPTDSAGGFRLVRAPALHQAGHPPRAPFRSRWPGRRREPVLRCRERGRGQRFWAAGDSPPPKPARSSIVRPAGAAGSNSSGSIALGRSSRGWESRTACPWLTHRCHRTAAASR